MDLLLAHGDDGSPALDHETDPSTAAAVAGPVERREETFLSDITADANDLVRQGWAVVAPAGAEGDRLEALVRELVRARAEDQGDEVLSIRVPPGMDSAAANEWKASAYPALYGQDEERRPRYLLILGDLDRVSLDTQHVLSQDGITGRLACFDDHGYGAYVDKVLRWQRAPSQHERPRALFYTVHDGSSATTAGHGKLILPCRDHCLRAARDKPREFPASAVEAHGAPSPDPDELLRLAAARHPSVLLSMSHGMGPPRRRRWSPAEAREHQGAMSFGTEGALEIRDLASAPFLPGGLWLYFACFGAGTPRTSAYHHWLEMLAEQGAELGPVNETLRGLDEGGGGFVSGLGKAALANPDGPLAVLSHVDLAWSYSYEELRVGGSQDARRVSGSSRSRNFFQADQQAGRRRASGRGDARAQARARRGERGAQRALRSQPARRRRRGRLARRAARARQPVDAAPGPARLRDAGRSGGAAAAGEPRAAVAAGPGAGPDRRPGPRPAPGLESTATRSIAWSARRSRSPAATSEGVVADAARRGAQRDRRGRRGLSRGRPRGAGGAAGPARAGERRRLVTRGDALTTLLIGNGIDAITGEYLLPAVDVRQVARGATGLAPRDQELADLQNKTRTSRQANFGVVEGVDPHDLASAGWAVVFPAVEDGSPAAARQAAIRDALAPLLSHRRAQAGGGALYRDYTGELGYRTGETKQQYLARLGAGPGPARPEKVPYYLLLVATPDEIPYHIQYQLDVHYAVGRIAFDSVEDYARYARSVVDAETGRVVRARRAALFGVANPNDASTRLSADHLVMPLVEHIEAGRAGHGFTVDSHLGDAATRARLAEILRDPPALLFTAGHGMGFPCGDPGQRELQGALLCQDWAGPGTPVAREHYFAGEDVPADADLRGMIGFLFACYGGGTPTRDEFTRRALGEATPRPLAPEALLARLPQRMLAQPAGGALAVVAHIDRAWGSTFLWIDAQGKSETQRHLDVFESTLDALMAGRRLGYAMEAFNLRYAELAADLSERLEQIQLYGESYEDSELAHMWICNSDARNYAVFGDPAVRIPRAAEQPAVRPGPSAKRDDTRPTGGPEMPEKREMPEMRDVPVRDVREMREGTQLVAPGGDEAPAARAAMPSFGLFGSKDDKEPGALTRLGSKLADVLGEVLNDAAVLEVKTYTSEDLQAIADGQPLQATGARLRAYTRCKLDGDTEVCVPVAAGGAIDEALWTLHVEMVKQAQAHRAELLRTVLSLFSSRVGK